MSGKEGEVLGDPRKVSVLDPLELLAARKERGFDLLSPGTHVSTRLQFRTGAVNPFNPGDLFHKTEEILTVQKPLRVMTVGVITPSDFDKLFVVPSISFAPSSPKLSALMQELRQMRREGSTNYPLAEKEKMEQVEVESRTLIASFIDQYPHLVPEGYNISGIKAVELTANLLSGKDVL